MSWVSANIISAIQKMSISPNTNKFNLFLFVSTAAPLVQRRIPEASIHAPVIIDIRLMMN